MKIKGMVEVEGVRLHVNIEVPDSREDIYITNVHPNCLVIPKERWPVEYLGLPPETLNDLRERGIRYLGDLADSRWQITANGFSENTKAELVRALENLRGAALIFERPTKEELAREVAGFPIEPLDTKDSVPSDVSLAAEVEKHLRELSLPQRVLDALWVIHKARTVEDVLALGKGRIIMTPTITSRDVSQLEFELGRLGHQLSPMGAPRSSAVSAEKGEGRG